MSNVRGRIAVDVQFTDSTTSAGVQSLKTITLQDATEHTTGKVAIVTGTCGTVAAFISTVPTTYRSASGEFVSFSSVSRVVASASQRVTVAEVPLGMVIHARQNDACVSSPDGTGVEGFEVTATAGTASYTLVLYGS